MSNFLLFAGHKSCPKGGFKDFYGFFETVEDAGVWFSGNYKKIAGDSDIDNWGHVVEAKTAKIIVEFSQGHAIYSTKEPSDLVVSELKQ